MSLFFLECCCAYVNFSCSLELK